MVINLGIVLWICGGVFFFLCTLYYMFELIPAYIRQRNSYVGNAPSYRRILELLDSSSMKFPTIKFQITTRGNETHVVKRGIKSIVEVAKSHPIVGRSIELLVVTENPTEIKEFTDYITEMDVFLNKKVLNVPNTYTTTKGTLLKARSLQFSLEYRKQNGEMKTNNNPQFIFYFDAESTISVEDFRRVIYSIISNPNKRLFEGPIVYPHRYFESGLISRQMEASRPFGCYHCAQVMKNPPPLHLHGSNLLVEEDLANEVGWDFGTVKNRPLLAEDLMFGLKAYSQFGSSIFGWHGGMILEQPPFSLRESFNARLRWITGAWQALILLKLLPSFQSLSFHKRFWILFRIRIRILTHSLSFLTSFFISITLLLFLIPPLSALLQINSGSVSSTFRYFQLLMTLFVFLPGTFLWLFGILNGLSKNVNPLNLSRKQKIAEYFKIILISPAAGAIESFCAFYATLRWLIGKPYANWYVTSK